ncbi:MAG: acylneuraminate cytidylyltransferase family protein [Candidatus Margulisiibacteriota bacterium]|nr:acylneuraminate cytidylyltransferase family protein [Candidatus Margulisiibacteriota bacterium]
MKKSKVVALIPARAGSQRVKNKNIRYLGGHPLIAYSIQTAIQSNLFDRVIVSTDSELFREIALYYGAEAPFLRPAEYATATSPGIEWIKHALTELDIKDGAFSIIRPTSPFRTVETVKRAWKEFVGNEGIDSLRAVELCSQHPGKMWVLEGNRMRPLLDQSHLEKPWHAGQYQALPKVHVQNSSLEIAWVRVVWEHNSREGKIIAPFLTSKEEGFVIDYERDWALADIMLKNGEAHLPQIDKKPFPMPESA